VPKDGKPADGKMAKGWMDAAAQDGIPTAFVVNGDGKVAWIGHPMNMEKPLDQIAKGTWDLVAATKEFKIAQASALRLRELMANLSKARKSGDPKDMLAVLDKAFESDAALEERFGPMKLTLLLKQGSPEKSAEYGKHLALALQDNAQGLNNIAWMIVDPAAKKADGALIKLAFDAAKRADELMHGKDGAIADTLAAAYAAQGDFAKALQAEERALDLAKGTPLEKDETMKQRLEEYKKAVKK
jgi:tetratricopeptide (TPR) repeat protein